MTTNLLPLPQTRGDLSQQESIFPGRKQIPPPLPPTRGDSFLQESIFPAFPAKLDKFACTRFYLYTERYYQTG